MLRTGLKFGIYSDAGQFTCQVRLPPCCGWQCAARAQPTTFTPAPQLGQPACVKCTVHAQPVLGLLRSWRRLNLAACMHVQHFPGSRGYEEVDAQTWAEWGVDSLKCKATCKAACSPALALV